VIAFIFAGFERYEIDDLMPAIVGELGLEHEVYSTLPTGGVDLYDADGNYLETKRALVIPGFAALLSDARDVVQRVSRLVPGCTVSMQTGGFVAALDGNELR